VGGQAVGADGGGVRDGDTIGFFEWLRDLRKGKEHGVEETAHASADTHRSVSTEGVEKVVCRICQCSEEEAPEYGALFSPCLCRGTMRYIHHGCLDTWRKLSSNAASNTQCDQCFYLYRVERRGLAKFVRVFGVLEVSAVIMLVISIIITGFLVKWGRLALDLPPSVGSLVQAVAGIEADGAAVAVARIEADAAAVATERVLLPQLVGIGEGIFSESQYWPIVVHHVILGCTGVGIVGFSTLVILLPMRGLGFIGYHPNLLRSAGASGGDPSSSVVLAIVVIAGMIRSLYLCYKLMLYLAAVVAQRSGTVILPADLSKDANGSQVRTSRPNRV